MSGTDNVRGFVSGQVGGATISSSRRARSHYAARRYRPYRPTRIRVPHYVLPPRIRVPRFVLSYRDARSSESTSIRAGF